MADAEVATPAGTDAGTAADSVEAPSVTVDAPPPTVNGVAEPGPASAAAGVDAAPPPAEDEAPGSKSGAAVAAAAVPRIDVSEDGDAEKSSAVYELHDKETESADRVAAALKSARLQVDCVLASDTQSLLGSVACTASMRHTATHVASSVVSVCWCAVQKRTNLSL